MKKLVFTNVFFCCLLMMSLGCNGNINNDIISNINTSVADNNIKLDSVMDEAFNQLQPGTAGSSLKAIISLVKILDYSFENKIDENAVKEWLSKIDSSDEMNSEKIELLISIMNSVKNNTLSELLSDAGINSSKYPWDNETIENVNKILILINDNIK